MGGRRNVRGWALICLGRPEDGLSEVERALELERSLGHAERGTGCLTNRAEALTALGRTAEAIETAGEALVVAERLGHREWTANALRALGLAHRAAGDLDSALVAFRRSLQVAENLPFFASWAAAGVASTGTATPLQSLPPPCRWPRSAGTW